MIHGTQRPSLAHGLRRELKPMIALAGPVVVAELGWISMGFVDTIMVGRLGPEAIGAVSIGGIIFFTVAIFGIGLLLGLDTVIAQAFGAGNLADCHRWLVQGIWLSLLLTPLLTVFALLTILLLPYLNIHPQVLEQAILYIKAITWGLLPLLLYTAFRRYLQAVGAARPVMYALVSANLINLGANWVLIFGHFGAPALGVAGAGWATTLSRIYLALFLLGIVLLHRRRGGPQEERVGSISHLPQRSRLLRLLTLGLPAALQITLEVGVFAVATTLAGQLEPAALAAHQIALNAASITFMVPLGVSSAAAVRVGHAWGRRDLEAARRAGWTALLLGESFMACAGLMFWLFPRQLLSLYTTDSQVMATGVSLLFVAAFFQLFDGLQVVATGALRGAGDTRRPMLCNLVGHWVLGLPIGYGLCFVLGWGVVGLWVGLSIGLIVVGVVLLSIWARQISPS